MSQGENTLIKMGDDNLRCNLAGGLEKLRAPDYWEHRNILRNRVVWGHFKSTL